ncbi:MAG TPA: GNAT family N-acetyltransferase [Pyrinomonadaceae bacterium]|nr:GNAT family N-acetyltransferase [Pyrinomonadaceae bacterium]
MKLTQAETPGQIEEAQRLFHEYQAWLGLDLCFQNFEQELKSLPGDYAPPSGRLILGEEGGATAGCVALRPAGEGVCEMKRLYVRPAFQGTGLGRRLAETIVGEARSSGYERMRLDTMPGVMERAVRLYRSLGFVETEPYYHSPVEGTLYMELRLR